jgi:hypothetical protein
LMLLAAVGQLTFYFRWNVRWLWLSEFVRHFFISSKELFNIGTRFDIRDIGSSDRFGIEQILKHFKASHEEIVYISSSWKYNSLVRKLCILLLTIPSSKCFSLMHVQLNAV